MADEDRYMYNSTLLIDGQFLVVKEKAGANAVLFCLSFAGSPVHSSRTGAGNSTIPCAHAADGVVPVRMRCAFPSTHGAWRVFFLFGKKNIVNVKGAKSQQLWFSR